MSRYSEMDTYSQAGDWLVGTFRRNPEALLLMAAGCVLLMRSGSSASSKSDGDSNRYATQAYPRSGAEWEGSGGRRGEWEGSGVRRGLSRAAESATDYAENIKDRVSSAAGSYAESVAEFADTARRTVSEHSERWARQASSTVQSGFGHVLREQPLALAVAGLAAGAAVAAAFPRTDIENRTLGGAREALAEAAGKAGEAMLDAAGKAGERLKTEGLKGLAGEVAQTLAGAVGGKADDLRSATTVPQSTSSPGMGSSTSAGTRAPIGSGAGGIGSTGAGGTGGSGGRSTR